MPGALATAGAAQTLEYLPRCDLGILLVNAGAPVAQEDVDVARALIHGGSELLLVASKADQLGASDLQQAISYVRAQFLERLAVPLSVHPVSTLATHASLSTAWFEQEVAPRLARHTDEAAQALKRKIAVLRESVVAVLEARLRSETEPARGSREPQRGTPEVASLRGRIGQIRSDLEYTGMQLLDLKLRLKEFAGEVVASVSHELAECWLNLPRADPGLAGRVEAAMARRGDEAGRAVARMLNDTRERMMHMLEESECSPEPVRELDHPRGRPILDVAAVPRLARYERPAWAPRLSSIARALAQARVRRTMLAGLGDQLQVYGEALSHWGTRYLEELKVRFEASVAAHESTERFGFEAALATGTAEAARRDLELLKAWPEEGIQDPRSLRTTYTNTS